MQDKMNWHEGDLPLSKIPDRLSVWSSSEIKDYQRCPRYSLFRKILGLTPDFPNHNLVFGTAWHLAQEHLANNKFSEDSIEGAYQDFLDFYRKYFSESTDLDYKGKNPGNASLGIQEMQKEGLKKMPSHKLVETETYGELPIPGIEGAVVSYKIDIVWETPRGIVAWDYKSGAAKFSWWVNEKHTSLQLRTYVFALFDIFGEEKVEGMIVKGSLFYTSKREHFDVLVRPTLKETHNWHNEIKRFFHTLQMDLDELAKAKRNLPVLNAFPRCTSGCVAYNKICPYYDICFSNANPLVFSDMLPSGFKREYYDPQRPDQER